MTEADFSISPVWINGVPLLPKKEGLPHWTRFEGNWYGVVPQPDGTNEYHCRGEYLIPWRGAVAGAMAYGGSTAAYYAGAPSPEGSIEGGQWRSPTEVAPRSRQRGSDTDLRSSGVAEPCLSLQSMT